MREMPLRFGPTRSLVGMLNTPADPAPGQLAAIFINAGMIHHIGPNRLHVQLARALAAVGVASLRFDFSGMGDSPHRVDQLSIYDIVRREPVEAMDALAQHGFERFVLVGMCSGAYSAFHAACDDTRVAAAIMINPEDLAIEATGESAVQSAAWARRYWSNSLFRPRAWLNLLSGRVNYRRLVETLARQFKASPGAGAGHASLQARMLQAVQARPLALLFLSSQTDVSVEYLDLVLDRETLAQAPDNAIERRTLADCDHLFTRLEDQRRLREFVVPWIASAATRR